MDSYLEKRMENDIPKLKILDIEYFLEKHAEKIVDFIEGKITQERLEAAMPAGEIFESRKPTNYRNAF
jgi:hypothetical protein